MPLLEELDKPEVVSFSSSEWRVTIPAGPRRIHGPSYTIFAREFLLPKPVVIQDATEQESRDHFLAGKAFEFWDDPIEDGYTLEDGDPPE